MAFKISKRQISTVIIASCVNFFCSLCYSLQAPFYPAEAEKKGATATEYGFVLGSYELVCFLACPFFGKILKTVEPKLVLGFGMTTISISIIIFGFLDQIEDRTSFIVSSLILRITEALGAAGAVVSGFAVVSNTFQDDVATAMSSLEMFYGLGFIIGPTIGGILFEIGGFRLPFIVIGVISFIVSILILLFVPDVTEQPVNNKKNDGRFFEALKIPSVAFDTVGTVAIAISQGFYTALLEPHLRTFHISQMAINFFFVISGCSYSLATPIFGRIVDKCVNPKHMIIFAFVLNIISFSIIGPLPYLPIPRTLELCAVALFIHGLSCASGNVSSFIDSIRSAIEAGFPPDISTYALLSGIWASSFSFGAFIGPSAAGCLFDLVGFQDATLFVIFIDTILLFTLVSRHIIRKRETIPYLIVGDPVSEMNLDSSCSENNESMNPLLISGAKRPDDVEPIPRISSKPFNSGVTYGTL